MIKDVRVILEETVNAASLEGVTDVGSISINEVIKGVLAKSVTAVASVAPMELFMEPTYRKYAQVPAPVVAYNKVEINKTSQTVEIPFNAYGHTMAESSNIDFSTNVTSAAYDASPSSPTSVPTKLIIQMPANNGSSTREEWVELAWNVEGRGEFVQTVYIEQTTADSGSPVYSEPATEGKMEKFAKYNGSYIYKPVDFLRFLYTQGDNWMRPVTILTPLSSPFTSIARSEINMSVGNEEKPLAVDSFVAGRGAVEVYPSPQFADFVYVERPIITKSDGLEYINCDDGIYHGATLYAAYLVAMIKGYANKDDYKAAAMDAIAVQAVPTNATAGAPVE